MKAYDVGLYFAMLDCGRRYMRGACGCGRHAIPMSCGSRLCLHCARRRAAKAVQRAEAVLENCERRRPRFVTLTLQRIPTGELSKGIDRLYDYVRALRKRYPRMFRGGWVSVETKWKRKTRDQAEGHHLHAHVITLGDEGGFVPQAELSETWRELTGGSFIVDVRGCHFHNGEWCYRRKNRVTGAVEWRPVFREALKYVTMGAAEKEGARGIEWSRAAIGEFLEATKGRRLLQTWGICHGVPVELEAPGCEHCGEQPTVEEGAFERPMSLDEARAWLQRPCELEELGGAYDDAPRLTWCATSGRWTAAPP